MCIGLGVTAAAAYVVVGSPAIMQAIASNQILGVGALIVGLGLVLYLSARVGKMTDSRGLPREDVRGHGRDARGARGVRLDSKAESGRGRVARLSGPHRASRLRGRGPLAPGGKDVCSRDPMAEEESIVTR
jgi:hypothetical protein